MLQEPLTLLNDASINRIAVGAVIYFEGYFFEVYD